MMYETAVPFRGEQREVRFEREAGDVFVWSFADDDTDPTGQAFATETEQQVIYEHLHEWWLDWTAPRPEDDL